MGPKWIVIATFAACLQGLNCYAAMPGVEGDAAKPELTDEVLVRGTRLRELRSAVVEAENRFYEHYNALNKVDDYDVECFRDLRTGTRIPQRLCLTKLQLESMSRHGQEALEMFQQQAPVSEFVPGSNADPGPAGMTGRGRPPNTDPVAIWLAHYDDYRDNMLYLLKMNPGLQRLAQAGEEAKRRYEAERSRRMAGRLVLSE